MAEGKLLRLYNDLRHFPAAFLGVESVKKELAERGLFLSRKKIKTILSLLPNYVEHVPRRRRGKTRKMESFGFLQEVHADIAFMPPCQFRKKTYRGFLVVIDCHSRLTMAKPLVNFQALTVWQAICQLFPRSFPRIFRTDRGSEFLSNQARFLKKNCTLLTRLAEAGYPFMADVAIRNLKKVLQRAGEMDKKKCWVSLLPQVVKKLNSVEHSSHGFRPASVASPLFDAQLSDTLYPERKNFKFLPHYQKAEKLYAQFLHPSGPGPKFRRGQQVYLDLPRDAFSRGYKKQRTRRYVIEDINLTIPTLPTYKLRGKPGRFKERSLAGVPPPRRLVIKSILDMRKNRKTGRHEFLVNFRNFSPNTWIDEGSL